MELQGIIAELNHFAKNGQIDAYFGLAKRLPEAEIFTPIRLFVMAQLENYRMMSMGKRTLPNGKTIYSMRNEALIVEELLAKVSNRNNFVIDIGASDGVDWSNSYQLFMSGADGIVVEGNRSKAVSLIKHCEEMRGNISIINCYVNPLTITQLLKGLGAPCDLDFLSLDIDSYEYDLIENLLEEYRPKVICLEINERLPPPIHYIFRYREPSIRRDMSMVSSASIAAWEVLFKRNNYKLYCLEYNNLFVIDGSVKCFSEYNQKSASEVYDDFRNLPDRETLFPWNSKIFASELDANGLFSFLDLSTQTIFDAFAMFLRRTRIENDRFELSMSSVDRIA